MEARKVPATDSPSLLLQSWGPFFRWSSNRQSQTRQAQVATCVAARKPKQRNNKLEDRCTSKTQGVTWSLSTANTGHDQKFREAERLVGVTRGKLKRTKLKLRLPNEAQERPGCTYRVCLQRRTVTWIRFCHQFAEDRWDKQYSVGCVICIRYAKIAGGASEAVWRQNLTSILFSSARTEILTPCPVLPQRMIQSFPIYTILLRLCTDTDVVFDPIHDGLVTQSLVQTVFSARVRTLGCPVTSCSCILSYNSETMDGACPLLTIFQVGGCFHRSCLNGSMAAEQDDIGSV